MSTRASAQGQVGRIADAATTVADSWICRAAIKVIGRIATFLTRRAERRLVWELAGLDDRLLRDIGVHRGMKVVLTFGQR